MNMQPAQNPWDVAMDPPKPVYENYGQMSVNAWFCALVKGQGKLPWDPNSLDPNTGTPPRRYTAIDMSLNVLSEQPLNHVERTMLAEFGEWPELVLPSLKAIGITSLQALNGQWVRCEMVPTGRKYTNQNGDERDATTFKFLVYASEAECRAAWQGAKGGNGSSPAPQQSTTTANNGNGNGAQERDTALKFLKPYVQNACNQASGDLVKAQQVLAPMLAGQKLLAKYFTVDSPEVMQLLAECVG
jgi:hypothetical protein